MLDHWTTRRRDITTAALVTAAFIALAVGLPTGGSASAEPQTTETTLSRPKDINVAARDAQLAVIRNNGYQVNKVVRHVTGGRATAYRGFSPPASKMTEPVSGCTASIWWDTGSDTFRFVRGASAGTSPLGVIDASGTRVDSRRFGEVCDPA